MPLSLEQKKNLVKEVADVVANADTLLTADFRGLTANELGEFPIFCFFPNSLQVWGSNLFTRAVCN